MVPLLRDVYTIGLPLARMLEKPVVPLWGIALIGAVLLKRGKAFDAADALLLAASLGFGLVYFLQRKGWPYHSYPMMAFALLAFGCAMTSSNDRTALGARMARRRLGRACGAVRVVDGLVQPFARCAAVAGGGGAARAASDHPGDLGQCRDRSSFDPRGRRRLGIARAGVAGGELRSLFAGNGIAEPANAGESGSLCRARTRMADCGFPQISADDRAGG